MSINFVCLACGKEKPAAARSAGRQCYCGERACQQSRKTAWQKQSLSTDADHRANHRRSHQAWCRAHPNYWAEYRRCHPDKAERNRRLQAQRDRRRRSILASTTVLAKMDALVSCKPGELPANGEFWLVPLLAKMDACRVRIVAITDD